VPESKSSLPLPPHELIDRVVSGFSNEGADEAVTLFLETGQRSLEDLRRALAVVGETLEGRARVLDFGCGCGRVMRWMEALGAGCTLVGTDIDERAIAWAGEHLPFARFDVNGPLPPTEYSDGEFDLVLNHSVFTHLNESYQDLWLGELQRITAPGGLLVLSTHGEHAFQSTEEQLAPGSREGRAWRETLERDGILYIAEDAYVGSAFPDFFHTAFHAPWYVFEHWSRWFEVLALLPRSSLAFQDQVVLRRPVDLIGRGRPPIRARPQSLAPPVPAPPQHEEIGIDAPLEVPTAASRFGALGLLARRALFRVARPILHAQHGVDLALAEKITSVDERVDARMPPLVHAALRQQAERLDRLDRELQEIRSVRSAKDTASGD
jgi:SAM-dependent methyltransferase